MRDPGPGDGHRDATIARGGRFALAHNPETLVGSERAFGLALRALDGVETPSLVMMTARCPIPGRDHGDSYIAGRGRFALAHNPETLVGSERAFGLALRALDGVETPSLVMMTAPCPMTAVLRQGLLYRPDGCACPRHAAPLMAALKLNVPTK